MQNKQLNVITCKAAVAWGPGEPMVIEEVEVSPPQPMEIRVKVVCTSLCRSDVTAWLSQAQASIYPRIFGHEASGIVECVGEGITEFVEGEHVLTLFTGECMSCRHCTSGKSNICQVLGLERKGVVHSDQNTQFSVKGKPVYHYCAVSSFRIWNGKLAFGKVVVKEEDQELHVMVLEDYKKQRWAENKLVIKLTFMKKQVGAPVMTVYGLHKSKLLLILTWNNDILVCTYNITTVKLTTIASGHEKKGRVILAAPCMFALKGLD